VSRIGKEDKPDSNDKSAFNGRLREHVRQIDDSSYVRDLKTLESALIVGLNEGKSEKLRDIRDRLIKLRIEAKTNTKQVINHSAMVMTVSRHLIAKHYEVAVEHILEKGPVCDIFACKSGSKKEEAVKDSIIVEIETGFVPPAHALDSNDSLMARIASKIERYSPNAEMFVIGTPPHNIVYIPEIFLKPSEKRKKEEISWWNNLCKKYYDNPPLDFHNSKGHIEKLYVINVDAGYLPSTYGKHPRARTPLVEELDVGDYMRKYRLVTRFPSWHRF